MTSFRTKFLWLVYDNIRSYPDDLNDKIEIGQELMGATRVTGGKKGSSKDYSKHFHIVAHDAIGCLEQNGLIDYKARRGWHVTGNLSQKAFEEIFAPKTEAVR